MARKKKLITRPKSTLGLNKKLEICYNCLFYNRDTGRCPHYIDGEYQYFDYNHHCDWIFGPYAPQE